MIYVDDIIYWPGDVAPQAQKYGRKWCHLWCDSGEEDQLHIHGAQNYSTMNPKRLIALDNRTLMEKIGHKKAGRLLDGREWNEMP